MKYIIGMGNVMRGDDGIGPHVIDYIMENKLEENFCAVDFATNAWGILPLLNLHTKKILIIDCARMEQQPGVSQFFTCDAVLYKNQISVESHESSIIQLINMARKTDYVIPDITIMGIEPESMVFGQDLSVRIANHLADYAQQAIQFIHSGG